MNRKRWMGSVTLLALLWVPARLVAGDADGDGVDDSIDVCCETPSGIAVDREGRPLADIDHNCHVDLRDYAMLQRGMTGSIALGCCVQGDCNDRDPCTVDGCDASTGMCTLDPLPGCGTCTLGGFCDAELLCDVPLAGSIANPLQSDELCFCAVQNARVRITMVEQAPSGPSFNPQWRLVDASGNPVAGCGTFTAAVSLDCGPLPAAGSPYRIQIEDGSRDDSGAYAVHLQNLEFDQACEDAVVRCDIPIVGVIEDPLDTDLIAFDTSLFDLSAPGLVRVSVIKEPGAEPGFNPQWRLLDQAGNPATSCGFLSGAISRDCGPLPGGANPYRIEILDGSRNGTGSYRVHLQPLAASTACDSRSLPCDDPFPAMIDDAADSDLLSFRVTEGERIRISVGEAAGSAPGFNPQWRLLTGTGNPAALCGGLTGAVSLDCGPLPASGNPYQVEVEDGSRTDPGSYAVHLQRLTAFRSCDEVPLPCGVVVSGTIDSVLDTDLLRFSIQEGETVRVGVFERTPSGPGFNPGWRLLDSTGKPASACGFFTGATSLDCGPLPASRNPYRLEIQDQSRNDTGAYDVIVDFITSGCP